MYVCDKKDEGEKDEQLEGEESKTDEFYSIYQKDMMNGFERTYLCDHRGIGTGFFPS